MISSTTLYWLVAYAPWALLLGLFYLLTQTVLDFPLSTYPHQLWTNFKNHHSNTKHKYQPRLLKALIFNHLNFNPEFAKKHDLTPREGAEEDGTKLDSVLKSFGFKISHHYDEKADSIKNIIKEASSDRSAAVFVFILTHGNYGSLAAYDKMYDPNELFNSFPIPRRFSISVQPKVLFIQACQSMNSLSNPKPVRWSCTPNLRDFLVVYATSPGYAAVRDKVGGTWLIQYLCQLLEKMSPGDKVNIHNLITSLNEIIHSEATWSNQKQITFTCCTFTRIFELLKNEPNFSQTRSRKFSGRLDTDGQGNVETIDNSMRTKSDIIEGFLTTQNSYEFPKNHTGRAILILNSKFRVGTGHFVDYGTLTTYKTRFLHTLSNLGFNPKNISTWLDYELEQILDGIKDLKDEIIQSKPDCLLIITAAIGNAAYLHAKDKTYEMRQLWAPFRNISQLRGKPKIFIINADETNYVPEISPPEMQIPEQDIPDADFLFAFSTGSELPAYFKPIGSHHVYLSALLDITDEMYTKKSTSFIDILIATHQRVKCRTQFSDIPFYLWNIRKAQIPNFNSTLVKELTFPKMFESEDRGRFHKFKSDFRKCRKCHYCRVFITVPLVIGTLIFAALYI